MAAQDQAPPRQNARETAATGGPFGAGHATYAIAAEQLLDLGYAQIPIIPGRKSPAPKRWTTLAIDSAQVAAWAQHYPYCGIGLRTGHLVGLDIDILDADLAWQVADLAQKRLGTTLLRIGLAPKQLALYRTLVPFPKIDVKSIEVLGAGQQFVAFGLHEATGRPYDWPLGETPLEVPLEDLPCVTQAQMTTFVAEAQAILPATQAPGRTLQRTVTGQQSIARRDDNGLVVDGRDAWLSSIAYHALQDAIERSDPLDADALIETTWTRIAGSTDLDRPQKGGGRGYTLADADRKVRDKLRLHRDGALKPRQRCGAEAGYSENCGHGRGSPEAA